MSQTSLLLPSSGFRTSANRRDSASLTRRPKTAFLEPIVPMQAFVEKKDVKQALEKEPVDQTIRPRSARIRPLSSRVFMRRTVKKGWIAKGIEEREEDDSLSDTGSLDSFFDDDFDGSTQSEALGGFLSCNTLGVDSKNNKNDWISGDIAIPKFHCPRCRDHWYGISAFPCDEELARLIREGKWYTGKEGSEHTHNAGSDARRKSNNQSSSSTSFDSNHLPDIKRKRGSGINITKSDRKVSFVSPTAKVGAKKNRKISFKLDSDGSELENSGSSGLIHDEENKGWRSRRNNRDFRHLDEGGLGDRDPNSRVGGGIDSSSSASDVNSGSLTTLSKGGSRHSRDLEKLSDQQFESLKDGKLNKTTTDEGKGNNSSSLENGIGNGDNELSKNASGSKNGARKYKIKKDSINTSETGREVKDGSGQGTSQLLNNGSDTAREMDALTRQPRDSDAEQRRGDKDTVKERIKKGKGTSDSLSSSRYGSRSSLHGGSQRWNTEGGGEAKKRERELIPGKGYMRASSPSQSDWGDPTHARAWASNTASSSRVSLLQSKDNRNPEDLDDEVVCLPPITNKQVKNPFVSDFLDGFSLTRAFTFSYH